MNNIARYKAYINTTQQLVLNYGGDVPFAIYLKQYFAQLKKHGSRDRKSIANYCYCYFRTCRCLPYTNFPRDLLTALFLCNNNSLEVLQLMSPELDSEISSPLPEKLFTAGVSAIDVFPFSDYLSPAIDLEQFTLSFLIQPKLFLRLRPNGQFVIAKLKQAAIPFKEITGTCLALPNGVRVEEILEINKEAVIQDKSSQQVARLFELVQLPRRFSVWDCCAASGGKALLLYDHFPAIDLTVSDIRQSILHNLSSRFQQAGLKHYQKLVVDASNAADLSNHFGNKQFDFIICDVPCSGSGTWSRTPEQLSTFNTAEVERYARLQKSIALNAAQYVKRAGYLLYITCSVFAAENEEVVKYLEANTGLALMKMEVIKGYNDGADTMFAALFSNPAVGEVF